MASILKVDKIRGTGLDSDTMSFDGSGNITIPKNVTFSGTTSGIVTSGTYTPQLFDAVTGGNGGGAEAANGNYVKIGTFCHVSIRMVNVTKSGLTGGNVAYFTLPFTSANIVSNYSTNKPQVAVLGGTSGSETPPVLVVNPNTIRFYFARIVDNSNSVEFTVDNIGSSFDLLTSVTYITAS